MVVEMFDNTWRLMHMLDLLRMQKTQRSRIEDQKDGRKHMFAILEAKLKANLLVAYRLRFCLFHPPKSLTRHKANVFAQIKVFLAQRTQKWFQSLEDN
jgi:hypothetical protein